LLPPQGQKTLALAEIVEIWEMFQGSNETFSDEPPGPVQPLSWHPKWIPFLWGGYGSEYVYLDLAPGPGGQVGQIILRTHGMETPTLIASSFETLVADAADHLEAGAYVYIAAANRLVFFNNLGNWDIES